MRREGWSPRASRRGVLARPDWACGLCPGLRLGLAADLEGLVAQWVQKHAHTHQI
jgi:hypothetical protein